MMSELVQGAIVFATAAHRAVGQKRKYTGECYTCHLQEVHDIVAQAKRFDESMLAAAWLHDTVEDTEVSISDIDVYFGRRVAELVYWLTETSKGWDGRRQFRKAFDRTFLAAAPADAQTIKLADLISNTTSIVEHDPKFARTYLIEKRQLLRVMDKGNKGLYKRAWELANQEFPR